MTNPISDRKERDQKEPDQKISDQRSNLKEPDPYTLPVQEADKPNDEAQNDRVLWTEKEWKDEKEAIRNLVDRYISAVETGSCSMEEIFVSDGELLAVERLFRTSSAIENQFIKMLREHYRMLRLVPESIEIAFKNKNEALILFQYHTECVTQDGSLYGIGGFEVQRAVRTDGTWKLNLVQYARIRTLQACEITLPDVLLEAETFTEQSQTD